MAVRFQSLLCRQGLHSYKLQWSGNDGMGVVHAKTVATVALGLIFK